MITSMMLSQRVQSMQMLRFSLSDHCRVPAEKLAKSRLMVQTVRPGTATTCRVHPPEGHRRCTKAGLLEARVSWGTKDRAASGRSDGESGYCPNKAQGPARFA